MKIDCADKKDKEMDIGERRGGDKHVNRIEE
jgi:hypothetical protein